MNNMQENELSMAVAVQQFLRDNSNITSTVAAFAASVIDLDNEVANIKGLALVQEKYSKATKATAKRDAEKKAIVHAVEIANGVRSYASKAGKTTLYESLDYTESGLEHVRDSDTITGLTAIRDIAQANVPFTADWNVTADDVDQLTTEITELTVLEQAPRNAQTAVAAATNELPVAFVRERKVLDELDGHVGRLKTKESFFYRGYQSVRIIVDNHGPKKGGGTKQDGDGTGEGEDGPKGGGTKL